MSETQIWGHNTSSDRTAEVTERVMDRVVGSYLTASSENRQLIQHSLPDHVADAFAEQAVAFGSLEEYSATLRGVVERIQEVGLNDTLTAIADERIRNGEIE